MERIREVEAKNKIVRPEENLGKRQPTKAAPLEKIGLEFILARLVHAQMYRTKRASVRVH